MRPPRAAARLRADRPAELRNRFPPPQQRTLLRFPAPQGEDPDPPPQRTIRTAQTHPSFHRPTARRLTRLSPVQQAVPTSRTPRRNDARPDPRLPRPPADTPPTVSPASSPRPMSATSPPRRNPEGGSPDKSAETSKVTSPPTSPTALKTVRGQNDRGIGAVIPRNGEPDSLCPVNHAPSPAHRSKGESVIRLGNQNRTVRGYGSRQFRPPAPGTALVLVPGREQKAARSPT